jgi:hypothetical protein
MDEKPQRRQLAFQNLDEVVADVENLRAKGYTKAGNWDLAQVCGHLSEWMRFPLDGFPKPGCLIGGMLWMMKITVGKGWKRKILRTGQMQAGKPTMPETVPAAGGDEAAAVNRLKEIVERFKAYKGEVYPSPLFGRMSLEEATKLQLVHCGHHLSFLVPSGA